MKQTLERIMELQKVTEEIEQLRHDKDMLAVDARNQQRIYDEKLRKAEQAHQRRIEAAKRADRTQMDIQQAEAAIARFNVQLNAVRHQKEYDAIQHSILSHRADIQKWEDEGLAALQAADDLRQEEERLASEAEEAKRELERIQQRVSGEQSHLVGRIAEREQELQRVRESVDPGALAAYDRLCGRTRSRPLAAVKERICQGCFTRITKQTENLLMRGHEIVYCHSCGRMLMLDE